jgi:hypothetical protein
MKLTKEQLKKKKAAAILGGIARAQKLSKSKRKRKNRRTESRLG